MEPNISHTVYVKKSRDIHIPISLEHHLKNPFMLFKKPKFEEFKINCKSFYKSGLKNKSWDLTKVEKIDISHCEIEPENIFEKTEDVKEDKKSHKIYKINIEQAIRDFEVISKLQKFDKNEMLKRRLNLKNETSKKTLLLDLDETLIKAFSIKPKRGISVQAEIPNNTGPSSDTYTVFVKIRPHLEYFLKELSPIYEIIAFTSGSPEYAKIITYHVLDPIEQYFSEVISRNSCVPNSGKMIKDLRVIANRQIKNMILVDDSALSFCAQISNGILVPPYNGDEKQDEDDTLRVLADFLKEVSIQENAKEYLEKTLKMKELYNAYVNGELTEFTNKKGLAKKSR